MPSKKVNNQQFLPKIVLAVFAHPDDVDFGAAGSIAKWVKTGAKIYYLIATRGCKGSTDPKMNSEKLAKVRQKEQQAAARVLGVGKVYFLGHTDGELEPALQLKEEIVRFIREVRPDTVLTFDPLMRYSQSRGFVNHPDHIAIGEATLAAVYPLARDRLTFPAHQKAGLVPHKVREILLTNFDEQNFFVDITKTFEKKLAALKCHRSQYDDFGKLAKMMRKWARVLGKKIKVRYAEGFKRISIEF
ncbi:hypothetical protein A3C33_01165 [Candidatus Curtissbacteria bacterium RIFCSPHIGHO2_02_FULL_42_58]|nr:MAG: hypothetical protein A3C33_01165 [Candidatus Curtissbacteria bacterium RIFCSPHIGHO2_02_FULL_42_58]OGD96948.1 MAG: hypothetical protein A3E71_00855 [Candidatus Curtissbacteria bacterium RIFCSPHIGHO2_12_FULL_42_33]OGE02220.1 MAG: hypothetical protein A3G16_01030 [Candidatus Curtissbacteria bacterium RIFCSPLOWO2_12_FULL_41_16]